ncbi:MAG: GNAT family N-acetyltransferase [Rhodobiaceae bacterium]|nr:MAG: GNAT family N-acetyltransferase [Rhodobiaceae bacterium]
MTDLSNWSKCARPGQSPLVGRFVRAEPFQASRDAQPLFDAIGENASLWTYIPAGPFSSAEELEGFFTFCQTNHNWLTYVFRSPAGEMLGTASYMRVRPEHGSAEVGSVIFSPTLQRTPAATEAMYLMARTIFDDLGYRRYEWKCNGNNAASKRAAERFGFTYEGTFRQDMVVKGENRDTCWYSMTDNEWPKVKHAFEAWLNPSNFDGTGTQRKKLASLRS